MITADGSNLPGSVEQVVQAESGYAYGVIGADLHVLGDGRPVYRLTNATTATPGTAPALDGHGLPAQPSHLLDARSAVVDFTGRDTEVRDLTDWRDSATGRAVRWLHAPGGQGKTRLARHIAAQAARDGWKVITAEHMPTRIDADEPAGHDLRPGTATGLLIVVDYADRWPLTHLTWLFSNKILIQDVPVRVLLLARTAHLWPALHHALTQAGWPPDACTTRPLNPLPGEHHARTSMFTTARDCFARHYRLPDAAAIDVPDWLERDEFGLTLAVHMAALVAVDRHARTPTRPAPEGMTALTAYLLERERHHWHTRHTTGRAGTDPAEGRAAFDTTPAEMCRAVFTAALTGPLGYRDAKAALDTAGAAADTDRMLADHTTCYPPADPRTVLEPLYPDRLAEDFLALCLPGHHVPGHIPDPWADGTPGLLLAPATEDGPLPPYAARAITFLTAASERWPHLISTLETLEALLPDDPDHTRGDLAAAAADLADRLARHRLPTTTDPAALARLHDNLGQWLDRASRTEKATAAHSEAVRLYRRLAATAPGPFEPELAGSALRLALSRVFGRMTPERAADDETPDQALAAFRESIETYRRLAAENPAEYKVNLVAALGVAAFLVPHLGQLHQAVALAGEAVELTRQLAREDPAEYEHTIPYMLVTLAAALAGSQPERACEFSREAVELARRMARENPTDREEDLSFALTTQASMLLRLGKVDDARAALGEVVEIRRRAPDSQAGDAWQDTMTGVLSTAWVHASPDDAAGLEIGVEMVRREARENPAATAPAALQAYFSLIWMLERLGRWEQVLVAQDAILDLVRTSEDIPDRNDFLLGALVERSSILAKLGWWEELLNSIGEISGVLLSESPARGAEACTGSALQSVTAKLADLPLGDPSDPYQWMACEEAIAVLGDIAAAYRRLARDDPAEYEPGLAVTLKMLAEALWILERHEDALAAGQEAIRFRRRLTRDGTPEHQAHLALALKRFAETAQRLQQHEKAAAAAGEAARIWRRLAHDDPAENEPVLAAALHVTSVNLLRPKKAAAPAAEAISILDRLARDDPTEHEPRLAIVLDHHAWLLRDLGRQDEFRDTLSRVIGLHRRLAELDPAAHLPRLALASWHLAHQHATDGTLAAAWTAVEEAVGVYTRLAAEEPQAFESDLDGARTTMHDILTDLARHDPHTGPVACPMPGTILRRTAGAEDNEWLVLLDQAREPGEEPSDDAMIGGWPLDAAGRPGPFQPNPGYRPAHHGAATDPIDFVLHLAAAGGQVGDRLVPAFRHSVVEIACDAQHRPLVGTAPDGVACALVATAPRHKQRLLMQHWWPVLGNDLPDIIPRGVDILLNPGGPTQFRLITAALAADA
ncbi:hypothetical protein SAMN05216215_1006116 [Saccharopolyspora shandongensis]|uniref:Tetratricopeptide repeat-containing protein n=1 Tax=Saccharopolyspora shandongensis TaxID=418495 RepID=A0A1H2XLQ4_9PSEU|nr:type VII secretion system-associated protein [Saccharopolyspora shandongensis]SDW93219.1 hypothetical protein SAMN05216215_1006116 [Saccharopolyspora shandongensis]